MQEQKNGNCNKTDYLVVEEIGGAVGSFIIMITNGIYDKGPWIKHR